MYWIFKTEPSECSIDDLARAGSAGVVWEGVRNYQARNFLRDQVQKGDLVLIHHSSCAEVGIAGVGVIVDTAFSDPSQFDAQSIYFDPKTTVDKAPWIAVRVAFESKFSQVLTLPVLRQQSALAEMILLKKGNRLSIMPATKAEFELVLSLSAE